MADRWCFAWSRILGETIALAVVAIAATAVSWALRADGLPWRADPIYYQRDLSAPVVTPAAALELYSAGDHLFVDTRPTAGDGSPTIPGALPIREATFDEDLYALFDFIMPEDPLVLFGDDNLSAASNVAGRLQDRGYRDLVILNGDLQAWRRAGGPVTGTAEPFPEQP